ncbi:MAG: glycosyltransferase family 1 protein [Armatimonadaceae bacterium]
MRVALHTPFVVHKHTGIARHIFGLLRGLAATDTETEYVCFWDPQEPFPDWLPSNFRAEPFTIAGGNPVARVLREQRWIEAAHRKHGFEALHSPFGYLPPRPPCPSVVTVHDCRWLRYPRTFSLLRGVFLRWAIPRSVRQARLTLTSSEATRREVLEWIPGVQAERVRTVLLGLDPVWFEPPPAPSVERLRQQTGQEPFFLAVGTQEPHKNLPRLLEAYALLRREIGEAHSLRLYLIGVQSFATGRHDDLGPVIARLGLQDRVRLLGATDDDLLRAAYHDATALIFPSYYEGFGYPPLEAMAAGTPVVTSDASCIPEIVGDAAELVDPFSADSLAAGMARLLTDPARRSELTTRGLAQARRYTWEDHARQMVHAYREATV